MITEVTSAIIHAIFLAIGLIMPLGAQNIFIFNQGVAQNPFWLALPSILTAAICDTILITAAVLGVSLVVLEIAWLKLVIFVFGFIFLIYMGFSIWRQEWGNTSKMSTAMPAKKQILFAASVSLLNPHAIIDTIAVIGSSAIAYNGITKLAFTLTCIIISWIWFFALSFAGHKVNKVDKNGKITKYVNKLAAIIMWLIACYLGQQIVLISF